MITLGGENGSSSGLLENNGASNPGTGDNRFIKPPLLFLNGSGSGSLLSALTIKTFYLLHLSVNFVRSNSY